MHGITSTFMVLLCTFLKTESLLFHGQTNATSASSGHSDPDVYKQLLQLETDLISIMKDQKQQAQKQTLLEGEIQTLRQWNQTAQTKISLLESENKILKERLDKLNTSSTSSQENACLNEKLKNLNSTSTYLLQESIILRDQIKILNSTSLLIQQNMTTVEDLKRLENILTFEIEQTVRDSEEKIMKNMTTTVTDLELRDRYLSLSLLDVHRNMTIFDYTLSQLHQQQKTNIEQQNMTIQNLSLSLLDVHNNTAGLSFSVSSLDAQQKQVKREIQTQTDSHRNDITKLNNTIIHLKNRVQSKVAFTAGILGERGQHTYTLGIVKFPQVIYQVGGGYNPTTGVFTAPKAGLYFIFSTAVANNKEILRTKIMINDSVKAGVIAWTRSSSDVYQSSSNLVVHQLQVGDRVWIEVFEGSHLYSEVPDTTFSVIMINESD